MIKKAEVNKSNINICIIASDFSVYWGKAIMLTIFNNGKEVGKATYCCHPEFESFDFYQSKNIDELADIAISNYLSTFESNNFKVAFENNLTLTLRFNL